MKPRILLIIFILIIVALIAVSVIFYIKFKKQALESVRLSEEKTTEVRRVIPKVTNIKVKLLFTSEEAPLLFIEEKEILTGDNIEDQCYDTIQELIKGPTSKKLIPTLPPEAKLNSLFITPDGTAFVDFSKEIIKEQSGGTEQELLALYSIVNTIILNFPSIKKVQILVNEMQKETLNGHIFIGVPLTYNKSLMSTEQNINLK
jgi:spore germination protein GerM